MPSSRWRWPGTAGSGNVVAHVDGQAEGQHADEMHGPDADPHRERAARQPVPRRRQVLAARTRFAMPNAVYDARTATPRDTRTSEGLYVPTSILGSCPGRIPPPRRPQFTSIRSQQLQIARRAILAVDAGDSRTLFLYFGRGLRPGRGDRRGRMSPGRAASDGHGAAGAVRQQRGACHAGRASGAKGWVIQKTGFQKLTNLHFARPRCASASSRLRLPKRGAIGPTPFGRPARSHAPWRQPSIRQGLTRPGPRGKLCRSAAAPREGARSARGGSHPSGPQRPWGARSARGLYTAIGAVSGAWCV